MWSGFDARLNGGIAVGGGCDFGTGDGRSPQCEYLDGTGAATGRLFSIGTGRGAGTGTGNGSAGISDGNRSSQGSGKGWACGAGKKAGNGANRVWMTRETAVPR